MPALCAAPVDCVIEAAVGIKFIHAQYGQLGIVLMPGGFGGMRYDQAKTPAVAEEIRDFKLLPRTMMTPNVSQAR